MEIENQAVCDVVATELLNRDFSLSVDCHSGFGTRDRLWFPYAHKRAPIAHLAEMQALSEALFASAEATEGMTAFIEKRPPSWAAATPGLGG